MKACDLYNILTIACLYFHKFFSSERKVPKKRGPKKKEKIIGPNTEICEVRIKLFNSCRFLGFNVKHEIFFPKRLKVWSEMFYKKKSKINNDMNRCAGYIHIFPEKWKFQNCRKSDPFGMDLVLKKTCFCWNMIFINLNF